MDQLSQSIPRLNSIELTSARFSSEYYHSRPVCISDVVPSWKAYTSWSPEYLQHILKDTPVKASYNQRGVFDIGAGEHHVMPFDDIVKLILSEHGCKYYVQQKALLVNFPELLHDIDAPYLLDATRQLKVVNLWFGGRGCRSPLHNDRPDNFFCQVFGSKRIILFPPDEAEHLCPFRDDDRRSHCSQIDVFNPDEKRFPSYKIARRKMFVSQVDPGDMLYIPSKWWHAVESLDVAISVNFWWYGREIESRREL